MKINNASENETETRRWYIDPILLEKGWDKGSIRMEYHISSRKTINSKKVDEKIADYVLYYYDVVVAVIEAKKVNLDYRTGLQQAIEYAKLLNTPYAYSTNGKKFAERNMITGEEKEIEMSNFPTKDELWQRYLIDNNLSNKVSNSINKNPLLFPYFSDPINPRKPRYYQISAINETLKAIARGQQKIMLVMATGTGKTYTAFQIAYKLFKTGIKKRVLFIADTNILIDQALSNDFKSLRKVSTKIKNHNLDSAHNFYFSLYQQLIGDNDEEYFREFKPNFFDLIIIDECHRGSARDNSNWRKILDYFSSATKIGLTATPKETKDISNINYFGEPVYVYSLKQGIDDGFLAPYRIIRVGLNVDQSGFQPYKDEKDKYGNEYDKSLYEHSDINKTIVIEDRDILVAKKITEFLKLEENSRFDKTLVFCEDNDHAERMKRAIINLNMDIVKDYSNYVLRIVSDAGNSSKWISENVDKFCDVKEKMPTIVTSTKLMSTGVDTKTCKLIVIDKNIKSIIPFKQIIGRGTRLDIANGKTFFTIMDFTGATRIFADENFDGTPISIYEQKISDPISEDITKDLLIDEDLANEDSYFDVGLSAEHERKDKLVVPEHRLNVNVLLEQYEYYDKDGNKIVNDIKSYARNIILEHYKTFSDFAIDWKKETNKKNILDKLDPTGEIFNKLKKKINKNQIDEFDIICHFAYDKNIMTRADRVKKVLNSGYLKRYDTLKETVLNKILEIYKKTGLYDFENTSILENEPFNEFDRNPLKIIKIFGSKLEYQKTLRDLQYQIYSD